MQTEIELLNYLKILLTVCYVNNSKKSCFFSKNYLKNFIISKEIFNIDIKYEDLDILKKYYDNTYEKVSVLVMDDEYVGITFDNLDKINTLIKKVS